jgi:hypothetical protein
MMTHPQITEMIVTQRRAELHSGAANARLVKAARTSHSGVRVLHPAPSVPARRTLRAQVLAAIGFGHARVGIHTTA